MLKILVLVVNPFYVWVLHKSCCTYHSLVKDALLRIPPMGWPIWESFRCRMDCRNEPENCVMTLKYRKRCKNILCIKHLGSKTDFMLELLCCWTSYIIYLFIKNKLYPISSSSNTAVALCESGSFGVVFSCYVPDVQNIRRMWQGIDPKPSFWGNNIFCFYINWK